MVTFEEIAEATKPKPLQFPGGFGSPIPGYDPSNEVQNEVYNFEGAHSVSRPDLVRINRMTGQIEEIATLVVNGKIFEDWETVWIEWNWNDYFARFRFTCAELEPYPNYPGMVMQIEPQSMCQIYLGGIKVIDGVVISRQVSYDAKMHGIMLEGMSASWFAERSSIQHKTNDFNNKTFLQIAAEVLAPTGVGFKVVGNINNIPFRSGATPGTGETIGQFLERLARERKVIVSNTPDGDFLFIGPHSWPAVGELIEGINIKKMQCVLTDIKARSMFNALGQKRGNDQSNMREAAEQEARIRGLLRRYSIKTTAMEHPVDSPVEIALRNDTEKMWDEDLTRIDANVTVYGWFRERPTEVPSIARATPTADLMTRMGHIIWQAGDEVIVQSPMAMLFRQKLKIRTVTWTQDSQNGSQTLLQLVDPRGLNGATPVLREPSKTSTDAPLTPPRMTWQGRDDVPE